MNEPTMDIQDELTRLRTENERLKSELMLHAVTILPEKDREFAKMRTRAERAEASCAEMRAVIEDNMFADNSDGEYRSACFCCETTRDVHEPDCKAAHAISTDCGKDYVPRAELEKAQAACADAIALLTKIANVPADGW